MKLCLDLFAGLGGFSAAFEDSSGWEVVTVEIEGEFNPDIQADILELTHNDLPDPDVVVCSIPCDTFSNSGSNRKDVDGNGRPLTDEGRDGLLLAHHSVGLVQALDPEWYFIENPMAGMRNVLGLPDAHVWWCQYGHECAKPTDLWGRIPPSFDARACHNGNEKCHHEKASRGSNSGTQASGKSSNERAELPYGLSEEVLRSVEYPEPEQMKLPTSSEAIAGGD